MFVVHATARLRGRLKPDLLDPAAMSSTSLGAWYATSLRWRSPVALFVNEATLLPVFAPLAPARTLMGRFPRALGRVLAAYGAPGWFVELELSGMDEYRLARTVNRSTVGMLTEFGFLADMARAPGQAFDVAALVDLAVDLARTPCGPLFKTHVSPDRAVAAHIAADTAARRARLQRSATEPGVFP